MVEAVAQEDRAPLFLDGTPYLRGLTHGKALGSRIQALVARWKDELEQGSGMNADELIVRFVDRTDYVAAMLRWTPDLLDEIRGIADGACVELDTMLCFQLVDELWNNLEVAFPEHCSSLGLPPQGGEPAFLAQTMDIERFRDGSQVVLHIRYPDSDLESLVLTSAGMIGLNGLNNRAVGICCNALMQLTSATSGLPVACVVRGVLQKQSLAEALDLCRTVDHASGQNYLIGGPDGVVALECSANQVVQLPVQGGGGAIWHTNHPLANDDTKGWFRERQERGGENPPLDNSMARYQALARRLSEYPAGRRLDQIREIMASKDSAQHPICASGREGEFYTDIGLFTFAATIMVLSKTPELHASLGPPDREPYQRFVF
jgi:hypothetical protein